MNFFRAITGNHTINACVLAWFFAQISKLVIVLLTQRKLDFSRLVGSGGMPSSHAAFVVALTIMVGRTEHFTSVIFAVTFAFAVVVMYDASGVRRAAGQQARILNKIVENWEKDDGAFAQKKLKELLGHTPVEVFVGSLYGLCIGMLYPL